MSAATYNIIIEQGATFSRVLTYRDSANAVVNLSGYTAQMQVRTSYEAADVAFEFSTTNGRISLGGAAGTITLSMSATETAALSAGSYVYDLKLVSGVTVSRPFEGTVTVKRGVTR